MKITQRFNLNNHKANILQKQPEDANLIESQATQNVKLNTDIQSTYAENLKNALSSIGFSNNEETLTLANNLLVNSLPITKENMQILNQASKLFDENSVEKGIFFLKNDLKPTKDLASQLDGYISKETQITSQLTDIFSTLSNSPNLKDAISILTGSKALETQHEALLDKMQSLKTDLSNLLSKDIDLNEKPIDTSSTNVADDAKDASSFEPANKLTVSTNNEINTAVNQSNLTTSSTVNLQQSAANAQKIDAFFKILFSNETLFKNNDILNLVPNKLSDIIKPPVLKDGFDAFDNSASLAETVNVSKDALTTIFKNQSLAEKPAALNSFQSGFQNSLKNEVDVSAKVILGKNQDAPNLSVTAKKDSLEFSQTEIDFENNLLKSLKNELNNKDLPKEFLEFLDVLKEFPELEHKTFEVLGQMKDFKSNLNEKLSFNIKNSKVEDLNEFFNDINKKVETLKSKIKDTTADKEQNQEVFKFIENVQKNIDFMGNIKNTMYFQIPLNIQNDHKTSELFVFKDKKNKKKSSEENGSALLSLDLAYLGHLETFIAKKSKNVSCQFRIKNKDTENLIKNNLPLLNDYLKEKNFHLTEVQFKELAESFSFISDITQTEKPINISSFNKEA